jgi:hypothetical protein
MQTDIAALGLFVVQNNAQVVVPVNVRLLPTALNAALAPLPQIVICPSERGEKMSFASAEGQVFKEYVVQVVIIAAGNLDTTGDLVTLTNWREMISRLYQGLNSANLAGLAGVWKSTVEYLPFLDRTGWTKAYNVVPLHVRIFTIEPRSNS